jgi:hypothetical protein
MTAAPVSPSKVLLLVIEVLKPELVLELVIGLVGLLLLALLVEIEALEVLSMLLPTTS